MLICSKEKRDKFYFEERPLPPHINFEDGDDNEQLLERGAIAFYAQGRTLEPLKTSQGRARLPGIAACSSRRPGRPRPFHKGAVENKALYPIYGRL